MSVLTKFAAVSIPAIALSLVSPSQASAAEYLGNFSQLGSGGSGSASGYYFFLGHDASQLFSGTGLTFVSGLDLLTSAGSAGNYASQPLTMTFAINGVDIGAHTWDVGTPASQSLGFNFSPITDLAGNYVLSARVTGPVCAGCGAVNFGTSNPFTLSNGTSAVPEPAAWAMLLIGFFGIGITLRRRENHRKVSVSYS